MQIWELLGSGRVPGSDHVMALMRRGDELVIRVDDRELMGSRVHGSEDALADLACDRLRDCAVARVLVGGLGMGFTLAAALRRLGPAGQVVVAELVPVVVEWNRGVVGEVAGRPLADPRVEVFEGDVSALIRETAQAWDAILLDVDNGPTALTRADNAGLYGWQGLDAAFVALRPGGILAVWSAAPDPGFTRRLEHAGFDVEVVEVRARGKKGGRRHTIWLGRRQRERRR
jgi:spermidine synthase